MSFLTSRTLSATSRTSIFKTLRPVTSTTIMQQTHRHQSSYAVPPNSWDGHMHVTDLSKFPSKKSDNSEYTAHSSTLDGARTNASRLSIPNLAFTQVSTYGQDNSCLLWCLDEMTAAHSRGVVDFDQSTTPLETLQRWHAQGVRGVRVNYKSVGATPSAEEVGRRLRALDAAIAPLATWAIHVHASLDAMPLLAAVVPTLGCKVCIDHMGSPPKGFDPDALVESDGWQALLAMLRRDGVFTKVSAPYRFLEGPEAWRRFEQPVKQLLRCRDGKAGVFASDWPHTRFEDTDIRPWVDCCLDWCGEDDRLRERLFRDNAKALYDVE